MTSDRTTPPGGMVLRPYQQDAIDATYEALRTNREENPCIVIPTAGGKTPILATICRDGVSRWGRRVVVLAHVRELLEQAVDKLNTICPDVATGLYSAGLKSRDTEHPCLVAGIQSVYKRATELGPIDLVIIDEAHLIPIEGDGMYRSFLRDALEVNPDLRVVGLTATPYRMKSGSICGPDNILNSICYEIGVHDLIDMGFICPLTTKASRSKIDTSNLHIRGGEYIDAEVQSLVDTKEIVEAACHEIVGRTADRKAVLIFAAGVAHGRHVAEVLREEHGLDIGEVYGDTLSDLRRQTLDEFRGGRLKYVVNVSVLSVGFDAPNIDCVTMLRPTLSPGLYYQQVGRGFRINPGKENCLVLDFAGNIFEHGPVDSITVRKRGDGSGGPAPVRECPMCHTVCAAACRECPDCGYKWPVPETVKHAAEPDEATIIGNDDPETLDVYATSYRVWSKKGAGPDHPRTLRVDYHVDARRWPVSEWICLEHSGGVRKKAEKWWWRRSDAPAPKTVEAAVEMANAGALCRTEQITIREQTDKLPKFLDYQFGPIPEWEPDDAPLQSLAEQQHDVAGEVTAG